MLVCHGFGEGAQTTNHDGNSEPTMPCLQVDVVQRAFILRMLSFSTFSKHLAAVRETNELLKRSMEMQSDDGGRCLQVQSVVPLCAAGRNDEVNSKLPMEVLF